MNNYLIYTILILPIAILFVGILYSIYFMLKNKLISIETSQHIYKHIVKPVFNITSHVAYLSVVIIIILSMSIMQTSGHANTRILTVEIENLQAELQIIQSEWLPPESMKIYDNLNSILFDDEEKRAFEIAKNIMNTLNNIYPKELRTGSLSEEELPLNYKILVSDAHNYLYNTAYEVFSLAKHRHLTGEMSDNELTFETEQWANVLAYYIIPKAMEADSIMQTSINQRLTSIRFMELGDALINLERYDESFSYFLLSNEFAVKAMMSALNENRMEQVVDTIDIIISTYKRLQSLHYNVNEIDENMVKHINVLIDAYRHVQIEVQRDF